MMAARFLAGLFLAIASSAWAAPPEPDGPIFGLEKLHWNMSPAQVRAAYPAILPATTKPGTFPLTNMGMLYFDDHSYAGCNFAGALFFDGSKLKSVEFSQDSRGSAAPACAERMEEEFTARFSVAIEHHAWQHIQP